jgi:hypothetical protein
MSPAGFLKAGGTGDLAIGAPFRFVTATNDVLAGVVRKLVPEKTFLGLVESLDKAMLWLELATVPGMGSFLYVALSTWGLPKADIDALGERLRSVVYGLFPQSTDKPASACAGTSGEEAGG